MQALAKLLVVTLFLTGCAVRGVSKINAQTTLDYNLLLSLPVEPISYIDQVKPILEQRCTVCHGCYDAPCQLKLSSIDGITRGASKQLVYDGARIFGTEPTRLNIDATTTEQWRAKKFHPVLNESNQGENTPAQNLEQSVLYKLLRQKQLHPQARVGMLSEEFDLGLNRAQVCPTVDEFQQYAEDHPSWGMPYAMPNLSDQEYKTLVQWLAQGSPASPPVASHKHSQEQIHQWESFFNGGSNKQKLVSRYLYEHLFQAHIHFADTPAREFYRLVRSTTPPGQPIVEIPSLRPYDDPGASPFYYRLRNYPASIVAKDHVVYELSPQKMSRYKELFYTPDYEVSELPSYDARIAANPFKVYEAIPPNMRYRFLLDNAKFFIEGFIKGPVCRGQIALSVIENQFWVFFFNPDHYLKTDDADFLRSFSNDLKIPSELGDTLNLTAAWTEYKGKLQQYEKAKRENFANLTRQKDLSQSMELLWNGDGNNPNAALTIFRHFDSASVNFGLAGDYPETAWVIDYPLLERIHYLLVAGFNVYGNVGHQLNTRLYMDFLRTDGEDSFLAFLPANKRKIIRDSWYVGVLEKLEKAVDKNGRWLQQELVTGYQTDDPQRELYQQLEAHLGPMAASSGLLKRCNTKPCEPTSESNAEQTADSAMLKVGEIKGSILQVFPDLAFVRIRNGDSKQGFAYTLIRNKAYKTISSLHDSNDDDRRDTQSDTLTIMKGLQGSYPNFFFDIELAQADEFADRYAKIKNRKDYEIFVDRFGIRRTHTDFWQISDWFQNYYAQQNPVTSGLFDLNRYQNR
jgi:hypothetical protein